MADIVQEIVGMHSLTASETSGNYVALPSVKGSPMSARVQYLNAQQASGSGVWTFTARVSYDLGATWTTVATGAAITLSTTIQEGEQVLSFTPASNSDAGQTWVQVLCTLTGSPVTPQLAYRADLVLPHPFA